jgi:2-iminobutanoate/2-iminopropanoate deaminase
VKPADTGSRRWSFSQIPEAQGFLKFKARTSRKGGSTRRGRVCSDDAQQIPRGSSMNKQVIKADVPETGGPFNLCVRYGNQIYISGLPPFDADFAAKLREARASGAPLPPFPDIPFERQVRIVMDHLKKLVEAAGSNMDCLLKVIVWLKDQRQQEEFDRIYRSYFSSTDALPARTRMQAGRTPMDCGLEVEAIGYVP